MSQEIALQQLVAAADALLEPEAFSDYCPNGLQVEGRPQVRKLVTGVTACQALIDEAAAWGADAILVHHGYFWKGEEPCLVGMKQRRVAALMAAEMSLIAYHLPLDAHPELGNNAQLAKRLGLQIEGGLQPDNPRSIGLVGELAKPQTLDQFSAQVAKLLGREPVVVSGGEHMIRRIGWCSGGAQGYIEQAADLGLDAYLSGEISEPTVHVARERQIHYLAAGHHATERLGAAAVGEYLAEMLGIEHRFIDVDSPA